MIKLSFYIHEIPEMFPELSDLLPWKFVSSISSILPQKIMQLSSGFNIKGNIAIHKTAVIEEHVILKGPAIISEKCFVGAHSYLRNGVYLGNDVSLGPGCEIKSSFIFSRTALAHFNFAGDSLIGSEINMEAGAVIANHFNERPSKEIEVIVQGQRLKTGTDKFGALIGDQTKIGANSVLSPGTILSPKSIVKRLELVEQG